MQRRFDFPILFKSKTIFHINSHKKKDKSNLISSPSATYEFDISPMIPFYLYLLIFLNFKINKNRINGQAPLYVCLYIYLYTSNEHVCNVIIVWFNPIIIHSRFFLFRCKGLAGLFYHIYDHCCYLFDKLFSNTFRCFSCADYLIFYFIFVSS